MSNIWHDMTPARIPAEDFVAVIEIEKGSKKKRGEKAPSMTKDERNAQIEALRREMKEAASQLRFEEAAFLRDRIKALETTK